MQSEFLSIADLCCVGETLFTVAVLTGLPVRCVGEEKVQMHLLSVTA